MNQYNDLLAKVPVALASLRSMGVQPRSWSERTYSGEPVAFSGYEICVTNDSGTRSDGGRDWHSYRDFVVITTEGVLAQVHSGVDVEVYRNPSRIDFMDAPKPLDAAALFKNEKLFNLVSKAINKLV